jgi:hypothetical protein
LGNLEQIPEIDIIQDDFIGRPLRPCHLFADDFQYLTQWGFIHSTNIFDHAKNYDIDVEVATSHDRLVTAILA